MMYFDMDGVLCDWKKSYEKNCAIPLNIFSSLSKEQRNVIKKSFITYDFFAQMEPIPKGVALFHTFRNSGMQIAILSAYGDIQTEAVKEAKQAWIHHYLGEETEVLFVRKVYEKPLMMKSGYDKHILIDDRKDAIEAWENAGGVGILFH